MLSKAFQSFLLSVITISAIHSGKVVNAQSPLPSCTSLSVASQFDCSTACSSKGETLADFRGVNGVVECGCSTSKVCDDDPSCADLLIVPGLGSDRCKTLCPSDSVVDFDDYVRYAGNVDNANIDQSHFVIACSCNGQERCSDSILFSDRNSLPECDDKQITSAETCQAHCQSFDNEENLVFLGYNYISSNGASVCVCTGSGADQATYCEDIARADFGGSAAGGRTVVVATILCLSAMTLMV